MKYKKFKELVINNMPENPIPGLWHQKGQPRTHILGNPSTSKQKAELINKYSLLQNVPSIDCNTIHLHPCAHHLNSSQIMCYNFFRPLVESYNGKMYKPKDSLLNLIGIEINQKIEPNGAVCNFEYIDDSAEKTNFDFYFKKGDVEVFFEIKYTEQEFSKKSSAKDPHARYEVIYKPMIEKAKELFIGEIISEDDFNNKYYQLARNSIRAISADKHVFFVCPKEHEGLINQFVEFSDKYLTEKGKERIKLITWEDIVQDAYRLGINVNEFANRYLAFML